MRPLSKKLFKVVFISDIHFGAIKAESLYLQLKSVFFRFIKDNKVDMIVIGGDLFHNTISMNYNTSYFILFFIKKLIDLAIKNNVKYIRIIQGTLSHDNNQLQNFRIFENIEAIDFKVILTVQDEVLYEGLNILYIPEEYMKDKDNYYKKYINDEKRYDFIFGHGLIDEAAYYASNQESEISMSKAPVFKSKELINSAKGPIYFGHIHQRMIIKKCIFYSGSFTRWKHGEEEDKGFYVCIYNKKSNKFISKFIINDLAPIYRNIIIEINDNTSTSDIDNIISNIEADYIKYTLHLNSNSTYIVDYLQNLYKNKNNIKIEIKNIKELKLESKEKEIDSNLDFIFDDKISNIEKIHRFIKIKYNKDIPIDVIKNEINEDYK